MYAEYAEYGDGGGDGYAADGETDRPKSASFFGSMKTVLASATASVKKGTKALGTAKPKGKFKPFDPETYEYIEREEALRRIQCQIRIKRAYRKIEKRKEQMKDDQKKQSEVSSAYDTALTCPHFLPNR